jgi:hypothetical protein
MQAITTIDLDIAKSVFQVGIGGDGKVIIRRQLRASLRLGIFPEVAAEPLGEHVLEAQDQL